MSPCWNFVCTSVFCTALACTKPECFSPFLRGPDESDVITSRTPDMPENSYL